MSDKHYLGYTVAQLEEAIGKVLNGWVDSSEVEVAYNNGYSIGYEKGLEEATPTLQSKTVTPSTSNQTITADVDYDGLLSVLVEAIPQTFIDEIYNQGYEAGYNDGALPYKTQLEYIQSSGTQYIDTGIQANANTVIHFKFRDLVLPRSGDHALLGSAWGQFSLLYSSVSAVKWYSSGSATVTVSSTAINEVVLTPTSITANGTTNSVSALSSYPAKNICVLNTGDNASGSGTWRGACKIYALQIYDNGTLVRDYIPVLTNDDIPCLYDKVNGTFTYNSGTGSFTY